jgi:hypothetical protein
VSLVCGIFLGSLNISAAKLIKKQTTEVVHKIKLKKFRAQSATNASSDFALFGKSKNFGQQPTQTVLFVRKLSPEPAV